jgi:hypothetical protein
VFELPFWCEGLVCSSILPYGPYHALRYRE